MANFDNGVSKYIVGKATIEVGFPVDMKGNADISCKQCMFYRWSTRTCDLNRMVCAYPEHFVGANCPLEFKEEETDGTEEYPL